MLSYSIGDVIAVKSRFELVGRIVELDEKGNGYKVDTGKEIVYRYDKEVVLISGYVSTTSSSVIQKIDAAGEFVKGFSDFRQSIIDFLKSNTMLAQTFATYVMKMPSNVLASCLEVIRDSGVEIKLTITINLINIKLV